MAATYGVNSAGSLVGSILESAGYIYQSAILDQFSDPFKNEIGGFVYLVGVLIVLIQFAILKSSKLAPWLLIGPAIFLFVIGQRDQIPNATWSFGTHKRVQSKVDQGVKEVTNGQSKANVSKVFKRYVEVVGATVDELVDRISGTQIENDLWLITKGQLYGMMTTMQSEDVGLKQLIQYALMGKCYLAIQAARAVDDPLKRAIQPNAIKSEIDAGLQYKAPSQAQAHSDYTKLMTDRNISFQGNDDILSFIAREEGLSGEEYANRKRDLAGYVFSCQEVWTYVRNAILKKAQTFENGLEREAQNVGMNVEAARNLLANASGIGGGQLKSTSDGSLGNQDADRIISAIAKYYLRNEYRNRDIGSRIAGLVGRNDIRRIGAKSQGSNAFTEQARIGAQEWAEKERLMYSAQSLPTYQGLALYFLALSFPFFALLLLIPSKATGFLLWFMLWLWIKSWDVALAVVAQIDTIFWSLYSVQKQKLLGPDILPNDFGATFAALENMDPTFQMTNYYTILAVCILAIPAITAQFLMGGLKGGASIIAQGMNKYSDFFADAMLVRTEQGVINQLKSDQIELKELRGAALAFGGATAREQMQGRANIMAINAPGGTSKYLSNNAINRVDFNEGYAGPNTRSGVALQSKSSSTINTRNEINLNNDLAKAAAGMMGYADPSAPMKSGNNNFMQSAISMALIDKGYLSTLSTQKQEIMRADANALISYMGFQTDIEKKSYEIQEKIAIFRGIPVPWLEFGEEGSAKELDRHKTEFAAKIELLKSLITTQAEGAKGVQKVINEQGFLAAGMITSYKAAEIVVNSMDEKFREAAIDVNSVRVDGNPEESKNNLIKLYAETYDEGTLNMMGSDLKNGRSLGDHLYRDVSEESFYIDSGDSDDRNNRYKFQRKDNSRGRN